MPSRKTSDEVLQSALGAARDNESRWMEMSPGALDDYEKAELWASTARLRRSEVERLEKLLAESVLEPGMPQ
jgi:hypothetical protein